MTDLLILYNPYYQSNVVEAHLEVLKAQGQVAFGKVRSKLKDEFEANSQVNLGAVSANSQANLGATNTNSQENLSENASGQNANSHSHANSSQNLSTPNPPEQKALQKSSTPEQASSQRPQNSSLHALSTLLDSSNSGFLQLFLTDYASLYVAKVVAIAPNAPDELVPSYYKQKKLNVEGYFFINDLREIVRDDFVCVRDRHLANFTTPEYENHTYALYGNAYAYPLLVEQKEEVRYFEGSERHFLQLFKSAEFLRQKQTLIDYTFGERYLYAMHPDSFDNLIYAELEFHACKGDKLFDFSAVVLRYAKCFEQECYVLVKKLVSVLAQRDERILSLTFMQANKSVAVRALLENKAMLGAYAHIIDNLLKNHIKKHLSEEFANFCKKFVKQIAFIQSVRNPAAHSATATLAQAIKMRSHLVGVAMPSVLLAMIKARTELLKG